MKTYFFPGESHAWGQGNKLWKRNTTLNSCTLMRNTSGGRNVTGSDGLSLIGGVDSAGDLCSCPVWRKFIEILTRSVIVPVLFGFQVTVPLPSATTLRTKLPWRGWYFCNSNKRRASFWDSQLWNSDEIKPIFSSYLSTFPTTSTSSLWGEGAVWMQQVHWVNYQLRDLN